MIFFKLSAQSFEPRGTRRGVISLGVRNNASLFNDGAWNNQGVGTGGQFRVQLGDQVNTDWFLDYITGTVGGYANREDLHIGWSVLLYPFKYEMKPKFIQPYVLAGHCFDFTRIKENNNPNNFAERWSSAIQAGLGAHFNLTDRFDISLTGQYMIHLGTDVHAIQENGIVSIEKEDGINLEGHILATVSLNYKIADIFKK